MRMCREARSAGFGFEGRTSDAHNHPTHERRGRRSAFIRRHRGGPARSAGDRCGEESERRGGPCAARRRRPRGRRPGRRLHRAALGRAMGSHGPRRPADRRRRERGCGGPLRNHPAGAGVHQRQPRNGRPAARSRSGSARRPGDRRDGADDLCARRRAGYGDLAARPRRRRERERGHERADGADVGRVGRAHGRGPPFCFHPPSPWRPRPICG